MVRTLFSRLASAVLIVSVSSGGGGLPVLDGLIFHTRGQAADALRPHYEATGGCHADGCAIRSTAHQTRFTAGLRPVGPVSAAPEVRSAAWLSTAPRSHSPFPHPQPDSRFA